MSDVAKLGGRRFENKMRLVGAASMAVLVLTSVLGPWAIGFWNGSDYASQDLSNCLASPSWEHPLGTDALGRDMLARLIYGCRISLLVGSISTLVSLIIGVGYGSISGYAGGRTDRLLMRLLDALYCIPAVVLVAVLFALFGRSFPLLLVALGGTSWLTMARVVRGQVLGLRHEVFVEAARASGASAGSIMVRHVVPNIFAPIIVCASLTVPSVILGEAFLSFLGLGVSPPTSSIGVLAQEGAAALALRPMLLTAPAILFAVMIASLTSIADGLREALGQQFFMNERISPQ